MINLLIRRPGRSSAWLERLLWEQEVARSNRVAPTYLNSGDSANLRHRPHRVLG